MIDPPQAGIERSSSETSRVRISGTLQLLHPATIFGITIQGVLPLFLLGGRLHILDRNLLSKIGDQNASESDKYWLSQLNSPSVTINPIFAATEGKSKRTPTIEEFSDEYFSAEAQIKKHLPLASLIPHTAQTVSSSYALVEDLRNRRERETEFLMRVVPLVAARPSDKDLLRREESILSIAETHGVTEGALSLLAVLSCLYEDSTGTPTSTGREVIHPKETYTAQMAHNCLSDLLALELVIVSSSLGLGDNAFISGDKRLGRFWQSLEATAGVPVEGKGRGHFRVTERLLNRIDNKGLERLQRALGGGTHNECDESS